jgi:mono/diheme cytochrome c family protein
VILDFRFWIFDWGPHIRIRRRLNRPRRLNHDQNSFRPCGGAAGCWVLILFLCLAGCEQQMAEQPRYDPLEPSTFFTDGQSARPLVPGTVARGDLREDTHLYAGITGGAPANAFPFAITAEVLKRGQERYNIFCSPCHARTGTGDGMIVRRGFTRPASFHIDRLRNVPPGYVFNVISHGMGAMPDYRHQIGANDRWAIVAYIRALQLSYNATLTDVPPEKLNSLAEVPSQ